MEFSVILLTYLLTITKDYFVALVTDHKFDFLVTQFQFNLLISTAEAILS